MKCTETESEIKCYLKVKYNHVIIINININGRAYDINVKNFEYRVAQKNETACFPQYVDAITGISV